MLSHKVVIHHKCQVGFPAAANPGDDLDHSVLVRCERAVVIVKGIFNDLFRISRVQADLIDGAQHFADLFFRDRLFFINIQNHLPAILPFLGLYIMCSSQRNARATIISKTLQGLISKHDAITGSSTPCSYPNRYRRPIPSS